MAILYKYAFDFGQVRFDNIDLVPDVVTALSVPEVAVGFNIALDAFDKANLDTFMEDSGFSFVEATTSVVALSVGFTVGLVAKVAIPQGAIIAAENDLGIPKIVLADADGPDNQQVPIGVALADAPIGGFVEGASSGLVAVPDTQWDVVPIQTDVGKRAYLSSTAGKWTLSSAFGIRAGVVIRGGSGLVIVKPDF